MPNPTHERRVARGLCRRCGKVKRGKSELCRECQVKQNARRNEMRAEDKANGICVTCRSRHVTGRFTSCEECRNRRPQRAERLAKTQEWRATVASEVLAAYGGKCACCGETEPLFLEIDHVNNDGGKHRREEVGRGGTSMYSWLKQHGYPEGFQVLCRNCNYGKHRNGGVCPHKQKGQ